jgi:hypothetical protein
MNELPPDPLPPVVDLRPLARGETLDAASEAILQRIVASGQAEQVWVVGEAGL